MPKINLNDIEMDIKSIGPETISKVDLMKTEIKENKEKIEKVNERLDNLPSKIDINEIKEKINYNKNYMEEMDHGLGFRIDALLEDQEIIKDIIREHHAKTVKVIAWSTLAIFLFQFILYTIMIYNIIF